jgi:hypothetical protein
MKRYPQLVTRLQIADDKADLSKVGFVFFGKVTLVELKVVRLRGKKSTKK